MPIYVSATADCNGLTTKSILECVEEKRFLADKSLNLSYKKVINSIGDKAEALRVVQRSWVSFRDEYCGDLLVNGGRESAVDNVNCLLDLTKAREVEILRLVDDSKRYISPYYKSIRIMKKAGYGEDEFILRLKKIESDSDLWVEYVEKNCNLANKIYGENFNGCVARLNFDKLF
ncbi:lysozyme inhibitor LprI family protein [Chitinivorax tropicus]|uniref:lysozyme inhibitor LprI family protein n=1 Tax=Chitinivorax tropicus TaxID=714531 RepID=UPI00248399C2|nr:lysozyme inhibitor LprI family protein [Chitinivorax tropicus]